MLAGNTRSAAKLATKRRERGSELPLWRMAKFRRRQGKLALQKDKVASAAKFAIKVTQKTGFITEDTERKGKKRNTRTPSHKDTKVKPV
jgi:hypothetical protein